MISETACNCVVNPTTTCIKHFDAVKHFDVKFFRNDFFVLATLKALWQRRNRLWIPILNNLLSV